MTKLTIITINYNNKQGLIKTFDSIRNQTCRGFQYIVIDGASSDGSREIIEKNSDIIDKWISEPDKGIYNAMNKGVNISDGTFCLFLNSGDSLYDKNTIDHSIPELDTVYDFITGNIWKDRNGKCVKTSSTTPMSITINHFISSTLSHPATFIKKELLIKRPYDESLKIVSDWKFFLECVLFEKIKYKRINVDISIFDCSGISSTNAELNQIERIETLSHFMAPNLYEEYSKVPHEIVAEYCKIADTQGLKKLLTSISRFIISCYKIIRTDQLQNNRTV